MSELRILDFDEVSYGKETKEYTVKARLNLREEPNLEAEIIRILEVGEVVKGVEENEWVAVEGGYCMRKFLD